MAADKGLTDYFAAQASNNFHLWDASVDHPGSGRSPVWLAKRVGNSALAQAYFRGDFGPLACRLDA